MKETYLVTKSSAWCIHSNGCFKILIGTKDIYELWYTEEDTLEIPDGYSHMLASSTEKEDLTLLMRFTISRIHEDNYIDLNDSNYNDPDIFPKLKLH